MSRASISIDGYLARAIGTVQGYLTGLDARLIAALLLYQAKRGITGHLCEIGVHHGRLFFLLALARRGDERALAIDLFEDDSINEKTRHAGRDHALLDNARRLGIELRDQEIFKTSSLDVKPEDILARTTGPIRFFSVDGSHLYHPVQNDLALAERTLSSDGIIAIDDFFNPAWPDVTFAAYDFLRSKSVFVPFAITSSKLYLAPASAAGSYMEALRSHGGLGKAADVQFLEGEVLELRQSVSEKAYEKLRAMVGRA